MSNALVVGGAGYIGSVTAALLAEQGWTVTVLDDLSTGHQAAIPPNARWLNVDIRDRKALLHAVEQVRPDCTLHFAARTLVGESFPKASEYFDVNVGGTTALLHTLIQCGFPRIVFSSSCTVYGEPDNLPIDEEAPVKPAVSPYGQTKQMNESSLAWLNKHNGLSYCSLRYFNAAGAWGNLGEDHRPESHLIPLCIDAAMSLRPPLKLFGVDYPTPDGTCVRDYIHIADLAQAHIAACHWLLQNQQGSSLVCNLGTGTGHSNLEVIRAVERAAGSRVPYNIVDRRPGDPPALVAANEKARRTLNWTPKFADLDVIAAHAWKWRTMFPKGYPQ